MTCWALQNGCQNLSFVKATGVVDKKMAGNTCKMAISYVCHFRFETEFKYFTTSEIWWFRYWLQYRPKVLDNYGFGLVWD